MRRGVSAIDSDRTLSRIRSMEPIIPIVRKEPFDDPAWLFDLKLDGFRGIADTISGRMLSKNSNRM